MSKASREAVASMVSAHAVHYNKPGRVQVIFFDRDGSECGHINMNGRELKQIHASQLKSVDCDRVVKAVFTFGDKETTCNMAAKTEGELGTRDFTIDFWVKPGPGPVHNEDKQPEPNQICEGM